MAYPTDFRLDPDIKAILQNLVRAIFPLTDWLQNRGPGGYVPPDANLPWRQPGARLSIDDFKVVDFLEDLLADSGTDSLAARWNKLIANPPQLDDHAADWRSARGLNPRGKFGILDSDNFLFSMGADRRKAATTRRQYYEAVWPNLRSVVLAANPQSPSDWDKLLGRLRTDDAALAWPRPNDAAVPVSAASDFIRRLTVDCLFGLLNFSNDELTPPWDAALLIEVGEFRRPNRKVSAQEAAEAVAAFVAKT